MPNQSYIILQTLRIIIIQKISRVHYLQARPIHIKITQASRIIKPNNNKINKLNNKTKPLIKQVCALWIYSSIRKTTVL